MEEKVRKALIDLGYSVINDEAFIFVNKDNMFSDYFMPYTLSDMRELFLYNSRDISNYRLISIKLCGIVSVGNLHISLSSESRINFVETDIIKLGIWRRRSGILEKV